MHRGKGRPHLILLFSILVLVAGVSLSSPAYANSITKTQSGLVVSDSMTSGNLQNWVLGGTASTHDAYEDSQGLHLGVRAPSGQWVNYYASHGQNGGYLFHTLITMPDNTIPDGVSNIGLYVEGSDFIPHVGCEAYADSTGHYWVVEQSYDAGQTYSILYITQPNGKPKTQDCTVITNGDNYLKVYIGGEMVYESNTLSLGMSTPFITFVQDDTSSSSAMRYGVYRDFYVTTDENIRITNNPQNAATVKIVDASNQVLASSPVVSGTATLDVGMYNFPLSGTIKVYDSSNSVLVSSAASIYGGDVYLVDVSTPVPPQPPTGLSSTAVSPSQINLSWTAPADNGGSAITGYKIERSTNGGSTWSVLVANSGSTSAIYSDTGLTSNTTYEYRVSAINSAGTSNPSNVASATTSAPAPTGIVLNGVKSSSGTASNSMTISNFNVGSGSNTLLLVGVSANNNDVSSITFGGISLTKAISSFFHNDSEFWFLKNPSGAGDIKVTMAGPTQAVIGAYAFSGVDQANPLPTTIATHNTAASSPSISLSTKYSNSWVLDLPSIWGGITLGSPTCTSQWDLTVPNSITGASSSNIVSSPTTASCGWTASDVDFWDNVAVELKAA